MHLAFVRTRSAGLRAGRGALVLTAAWLSLAPLPGAAQEASGPAAMRIPIGEIDAAPQTPLVGSFKSRSAASATKALVALPAAASRRHTLDLPDRRLSFTVKAGAVGFEDESGAVVAEIGYFAYLLDGAEAKKRPVTFAINGGPGSASAWLHLGALGPWRLPIGPNSARPTAPADLVPNADTWLDFTDIVFIDPVGTGYTRLLPAAAPKPDQAKDGKDSKPETDRKPRKAAGPGRGTDTLRDRFWSVPGDIASISVFMKRWLEANGRTDSPKVLLGESYGGFRAPRVAQSMQAMPGFALNGIIMVSPALSGWGFEPGLSGVMSKVAQFPSLAAAIADAKGPVTAAQLAAFEREAAGPYMADLLAGPRDKAAAERLVQRIVAVTGLDAETVRQLGPRSSARTFLGAVDGKLGRTYSVYDATFKRDAAYDGPTLVDSGGDDLGGLATQLARGMARLDKQHVGWGPGRDYLMRGSGWSWFGQESVSSLRSVLVRDPTFRVLIAHGYADLVTPYFRTRLILDQLPTIGADNHRVRLEVYGGGHMFYSRDHARAQFRRHAVRFFEELAGPAAKG
jgi:carboxypeptidase C (cathepsin A)